MSNALAFPSTVTASRVARMPANPTWPAMERQPDPARQGLILIGHSCALIAAGLASILRRASGLDVSIWEESSHATGATWDGTIDFVVADSMHLSRLRWANGLASRGNTRRPKVVWLAEPAEPASSLPRELHAISIRLPVDSGEEDLLAAISRDGNQTRPDCWSTPSKRPCGGLAPGALRRVKEHIEAQIAEPIQMKSLARIAGLSECHFSRAFKQSVGLPPHRYVISRRVSAARVLIRDTDLALTDVALEVGFFDHSHFTRIFVRATGETPRAYRRRHR